LVTVKNTVNKGSKKNYTSGARGRRKGLKKSSGGGPKVSEEFNRGGHHWKGTRREALRRIQGGVEYSKVKSRDALKRT